MKEPIMMQVFSSLLGLMIGFYIFITMNSRTYFEFILYVALFMAGGAQLGLYIGRKLDRLLLQKCGSAYTQIGNLTVYGGVCASILFYLGSFISIYLAIFLVVITIVITLSWHLKH